MTTRLKLLLVAVVFLMIVTAPNAVAAADDQLLSLVPSDAVSVGLIRIDDMRRSPTAHGIFTKMSAAMEEEAEHLLRDAGLDPSRDVDVIVVAVSPSGTSERPRVLVAASGRFDPARLGKLIEREGATRKSAGGTSYYLLPEEDVRPGEHPSVSFIGRDLVVAGTEDAVVATIRATRGERNRFDRSRLGRELFRIDSRASGWMLFDVQRAKELVNLERPGATPFGDQAFATMKDISTISLWVAETNRGLEFGSAAVAADAETRALVADVLKGALAGLRLAAQEQQPEMVRVIRRFEIDSTPEAVTLTGTIPAELLHDLLARIH